MADRAPINVTVVGSTGSIGRGCLDVIRRFPDRFTAFGLACARNQSELGRQIDEFRPTYAVATDAPVRSGAPIGDAAAIQDMICDERCDLVLMAVAGSAALAPTLAALAAGKVVALATKEVLVMAGHLVTKALAGNPQRLRPVDSEHSAIWQCLWGEDSASIRRLILTASGGPFWGSPELDLGAVTVEQALAHPRWKMGPKVTVDSATMLNKGLEVIEAHHLFGVACDQVEVLVHPQSLVHSVVEFVDGASKAQIATPDMRIPIALAMSYPRRLPGIGGAVQMELESPFNFYPLDGARFPAVELAREAARREGTFPAVLNAANEQAVALFLDGRVRFDRIVPLVEAVLTAHQSFGSDLGAILEADAWARSELRQRASEVLQS